MKVSRFLFLFFTVAFSVTGIIFYSQFSAPQRLAGEERFVVDLSANEEQIINDLAEKGFIRNENFFSLILDITCWQKNTRLDLLIGKQRIKPGAYMISKNFNAFKLAQKLIGEPYQKWVIIPPGKRKEQIALILQKSLGWPRDMAFSFIKIAQEGFLGADSYLINTDADPQQVIQKFTTNFNEKFDAKVLQDLLARNIRNDTAIKIASLIERESGGIEDKPIISAVIWNRLEKKMKLEIDATVQYVIASTKFKEQSSKLSDDFSFWESLPPNTVRKIDSSYNTYLNKGLPPGPICSPSVESIRAVANPAETDALYYLHSPDKKIHTAKTYKEHQENIEKYLQ